MATSGASAQRGLHRHAVLDGERRRVRAEAEVGGVAERRHAAGAHHELQARANSAKTRMSVASTRRYSSPVNGRSAASASAASAPMRRLAAGRHDERRGTRQRRRRRHRRRRAHQPMRLHGQHDGHDDEFGHQRELGKGDLVTPPNSTVPSAMHSALVRPMSSAATKAPGIEPRPPTTVTTNASAMIARSMPRLAGSRGSCSAPASPAQERAEREHQREERALVDAERARKRAILGRGARSACRIAFARAATRARAARAARRRAGRDRRSESRGRRSPTRRSIPARADRADPRRPRRTTRHRERSARCRTSRRAAGAPARRRFASAAAPRSRRR